MLPDDLAKEIRELQSALATVKRYYVKICQSVDSDCPEYALDEANQIGIEIKAIELKLQNMLNKVGQGIS